MAISSSVLNPVLLYSMIHYAQKENAGFVASIPIIQSLNCKLLKYSHYFFFTTNLLQNVLVLHDLCFFEK